MKLLLSILVTCLLTSTPALARGKVSLQNDDRFPIAPKANITPGSLCERPSYYRYPENIPYCERNVDKYTKDSIIREYDRRFGYEISTMNRQDFKIDHYIPLCMGGSNGRDNLWPQHKTVFVYTDLIEQRTCELMAKGKLTQADAVELIKHVKSHLEECEDVLEDLTERLHD